MERGVDLADRLRTHAVDAGLFPVPGLALLAVSGGGDSAALLELFRAVGADLGLTLAVAHVDHGIAPESSRVAGAVERGARSRGLPVYVTRLTLGPGTSETRARHERYRALRRFQRDAGARYVLTAHHADDQVETVLFRVLRGSGPAGLAGIAERGPGGLVRPLLPFNRAELRAWLTAHPAPFPVHDDPANADSRHDRSWLRACVLPLLRERMGPALDDNLLRLAAQARRERDAWREALAVLPDLAIRRTPSGIEVARVPLAAYDNALREAVLRALAREVGFTLGRRAAARLSAFLEGARSGRRLELREGWTAEVVFDRLRIERSRVGPEASSPAQWGNEPTGEVVWGRWRIAWRTEPAGTIGRAGWRTWVTLGGGSVRGALTGERMRPFGSAGHRPVRRLLMEARVPRGERMTYPVVVRNGEVLWIPGVCRADAAAPRPGEPALRLEVGLREPPATP